VALTVAAQPPDDQHEYGHDKAEYFSSGTEGALILVAAASIAWTSVERLLNPRPIEQLGIGLAVSVVASLVNLVVARILLQAGRQYNSIMLEADARHLMTDVWTSVGVVFGVAAVGLTGWGWLDPVIALAVAANIVWTGFTLLRRSAGGLMDTALATEDRLKLDEILNAHIDDGIVFHAIRTRQAGSRRFVTFHVLVPGNWSVRRGHTLLEQIEKEVREALPNTIIDTHLEPLEDPVSWQHDAAAPHEAPSETSD